jgi:hypothetical protein
VLAKVNNLSDVANVPSARTNLSVYSKAEIDAAIAALTGGAGRAASYSGFLDATPPNPASFTLVGSNPVGTVVTYVATVYTSIVMPAIAATSGTYLRATPAPPWNIYVAVSILCDSTTGNDVSVGLFTAANAQLRLIRATQISGQWRWTVTSNSGDLVTLGGAQPFGTNAAIFMRISNDGTTVSYWYSTDNGLSWWRVFSEAASGVTTGTQWGFKLNNQGSSHGLNATFWACYTA